MRNIIIVFLILLFAVSFVYADDKCVSEKLVLEAWSDAVSRIERPSANYRSVTANCDPCKCPVNGMADCYEFMAQNERNEQKRYKDAIDLLDRAKKYGICR